MSSSQPPLDEPGSPAARVDPREQSVDARQPGREPRDDSLDFELPPPATPGRHRTFLAGLMFLLLCAGAFAVGYLPRQSAQAALREGARAAANAVPELDTIRPKRVDETRSMVLPGSVQALNSTVLYPRAQGYVKSYLVDLGDRVQTGQLLAEIETPELDQQLDQARAQLVQSEAQLGQAKANRDFSNTSLARYRVLRPAGVASQQELDQRSAQALVDEANVRAAEAAIAVQRANLRRLAQLQSFAEVRAPFAGVIASRSIDLGALVSAGNVTPLFELVATDPVRVFVQVPQDVATSVRTGMPAQVSMREYPGRRFEGFVARSAGALDNATRTMRTEVRVPNPDNALLTGMYAEVALPLASPHAVYEVPATSVITDEHGLRVALVDENGRIRMRKVSIERDLGATIQIAQGLQGGERIVRLASAALSEGQRAKARDGG